MNEAVKPSHRQPRRTTTGPELSLPGKTPRPAPRTLSDKLRKFRKRLVRKPGKRIRNWLSGFLGGQSLVPDIPVFETGLFPFLEALENDWEAVRDELQPILEQRKHVPPFHVISPDQKKISQGEDWRTFFLSGFGYRVDSNCRRCPRTSALLDRVPNLCNAWFSILAPGCHIPPHRGVTKGIIRCHLALVLPERRDRCLIRVEDQIRQWDLGKCLVFDDTYEHEVRNDTEQERVVLAFDFHRPMRWRGRLVNQLFLKAIRRTHYFRRPLRISAAWEARFERAAHRAKEHRKGSRIGR